MSDVQLVPLASNSRLCTGGTVIEAEFPCVLGRAPGCTYRLDNPRVSRRHCALWLREGRVFVQDLGSSNGTRLNDDRLTSPQAVFDGDVLFLANLPFQVRLTGRAAETARIQADVGAETKA